MGPRKDKTVGDNNWRTSIEEEPLDDALFSAKVILIESAGSEQDRIYLNKFEIFATEEKRFVIKNISKTETMFMVNQLGDKKRVKDINLRVFEEGQTFLKDKKDIPVDILALIIKRLILEMKDEYLFIEQQRLVVKEGIRRESTTMIDGTEVRSTVIVKQTELVEPLKVPKSKGKKSATVPSTPVNEPDRDKKYNTSLRVRGEEWRDKVYVDDFPTDGPKLYVIVTGFANTDLPICLINIGVPVVAVVQVRINPQRTKIPSTLFRSTKRGASQTDILAEKSQQFWDEIQQLRINKDSSDTLKDTAFIIFSPPYWESNELSGNPEKIYDEICYLMYDIQDLTRQHTHYLDNMDVVNIPDDYYFESLMKYYHLLIDEMPLECVTTFSILDSILQTVTAYQEIVNENNKSSSSTVSSLNNLHNQNEKNNQPDSLITEIFNALCENKSATKYYRVTFGEEYESYKDPIVINYGDFVKHTTFHLNNIDLKSVIWSSLFNMPINSLWRYQKKPRGEIEAKINFHVNTLLSCFERKDVETVELNRMIHVLACRKLFNNRSSLKKDHLSSSTISDFKKTYLKRSIYAEPITVNSLFQISNSTLPSFPSMTNSEDGLQLAYEDDSEVYRIKFLFECPDISELVSATEIANGKPLHHIVDDFDFFEDLHGVSALQIMFDVFSKYNCVDYKYCSVTDCIILMFYNSHDKEGISRVEWRNHISTPVCLQDFFDFTLEEICEWIRNEEKNYDEKIKIKSQSESKDMLDTVAIHTCIEHIDVELELLMEGSLKYNETKKNYDANIDTTLTEVTTSGKTTTYTASTDGAKSSRKSKSPTSKPKYVREKEQELVDPESSVPKIKKMFTCYDLSDRRMEAFGKDETYFSKDGSRVTSSYVLLIPSNLEYIMLNVAPGNASTDFWIQKALGKFAIPKTIEACESFRITNKDQIMININKQSYQDQLGSQEVNSLPINNNRSRRDDESTDTLKVTDRENAMPQITDTKNYYSMFITWPNGLLTEVVHEINSYFISHIKQYHTLLFPELAEEMRCISLNGEVIIFKRSGDIEVFQPCGNYIKITKCMKTVVLPPVPEEGSADRSLENSKGKQKKKEKSPEEKSRKSCLKSSKFTLEDDENAEKKHEYELTIEEFEIIETSGLRQMWVNNKSYDIEKLLIRTATDYNLGEVFSRRMDGTNTLINKDGIQIVTFPDKTRIVTEVIIEDREIYPELTPEEIVYFSMLDSEVLEVGELSSKSSRSKKSFLDTNSTSIDESHISNVIEDEKNKEEERTDGYISVQLLFTIEHVNFTSISINKSNKNIVITSPHNVTVTVDPNNHYNFQLDSATSAKFDGEILNISYEACSECGSTTTCKINIENDEILNDTKTIGTWLTMKDSFCNKIIVDMEGNISRLNEPCSDENLHTDDLTHGNATNAENPEDKPSDGKSETYTSHGKCRDLYLSKKMRFFVLRRDLTCSELIHKVLVDHYKRACRWLPWCSITQHDTFGDYRNLLAILTPINLTETEKWLMDSKLADKPRYLAYKDLKSDSNKGFYQWMRHYERFKPKPMKPANALPPRVPRAFIKRTLEQQWNESERKNLKGGKELLTAILVYRRLMEESCDLLLDVPIIDPRTDEERRIEEEVQALGHRIYEDLKRQLEKDVESRAKADITTRPVPPCDEMYGEGEMEDESVDECLKAKALEQERESILKELEMAEPMSASLQRYWRRRAEQAKEEQFYKYLLREDNVPPYFRNMLGGAIWWEMNNAAGVAAETSERRRMSCSCPDESPCNDVLNLHFL